MRGVKLKQQGDNFFFFCPGCACDHAVRVFGTEQPKWEWNGSMRAPTFRPSVRTFDCETNETWCHFHVSDGRLEFLGDSKHRYANSTVPMEDVE